MGRFLDLAAWIEGNSLRVRWSYDGDTGSIYNLKIRVYQDGELGDYTASPRYFYKLSNPPKTGELGIPLSSIVDEDTGQPFEIKAGTSWIHAWWDAFYVTYGRADAMIQSYETPPAGEGSFVSVKYYKDQQGKVWLSYKAQATVAVPAVYVEQYNPEGGYKSWTFSELEKTWEGEAWPSLREGHMAYFRLWDYETDRILDEKYAELQVAAAPHPVPVVVSDTLPSTATEGSIVRFSVNVQNTGTSGWIGVVMDAVGVEKEDAYAYVESGKTFQFVLDFQMPGRNVDVVISTYYWDLDTRPPSGPGVTAATVRRMVSLEPRGIGLVAAFCPVIFVGGVIGASLGRRYLGLD